MQKITNIVMVTALTVGTACSFDQAGLEEESLYSQLGTREVLDLETDSVIGIDVQDQNGDPIPCLSPAVIGGSAVLRSTKSGLLLVEDLDIVLSDMIIPAGVLHSEDVVLTDISLHLGTQIVVEAEWQGVSRAVGVGGADLLLDWAVLDDSGEHYPLATMRLREASFSVDVHRNDDGTIGASVVTGLEGHLGTFANRIEMQDFRMAVTAVSEPLPY